MIPSDDVMKKMYEFEKTLTERVETLENRNNELMTRVEDLESMRQPVYIGKRRPDNPFLGQLWADTSQDVLKMYVDGTWIIINYVPLVGGIIRHTAATPQNIDWSQGKVHYVPMTANTTFTFSNPSDGGRYLLIIKEAGSGNYTPTFPNNVKWVGNITPSYIKTLNTYLVISFAYDATLLKYFAIESDGYV